ncbi:MAG TPA: hypothetical protein VHO91_01770, partial [Rhodopila sp.]|nr:hypothetical protein [Rhodopila sp.]
MERGTRHACAAAKARALVLGGFFALSATATAGGVAILPGTPAGKLAGALVHHMDTDSPARIRAWGEGVLPPSMDAPTKAGFLDALASAARDSGGVDVFDVRTDSRQPGLLEVALKGRR